MKWYIRENRRSRWPQICFGSQTKTIYIYIYCDSAAMTHDTSRLLMDNQACRWMRKCWGWGGEVVWALQNTSPNQVAIRTLFEDIKIPFRSCQISRVEKQHNTTGNTLVDLCIERSDLTVSNQCVLIAEHTNTHTNKWTTTTDCQYETRNFQ